MTFPPERIERLVLLRIIVPLAVLGFLSSRIVHASEWLGAVGFEVPDLGGDVHQPIYLPRLSVGAARVVAGALVASGLAVSAGCFFRPACALFGALLAYVALADRMASFTVTKLGTVVVVALACTTAGARWSIDARSEAGPPRSGAAPAKKKRTAKRFLSGPRLAALAPPGEVAFFQALVCVFYASSGIAKMRGDWLREPYVLWTHLHDSYQTWFAYACANVLPRFVWPVFQALTLAYEAGAPIWFGWSKSRPYALLFGLVLHATIGAMFGPLFWFSLLMSALLVASFAPDRLIVGAFERLSARGAGR